MTEKKAKKSTLFEKQMQKAAINGQASSLSSVPRWAVDLDRKLDLIISLKEAGIPTTPRPERAIGEAQRRQGVPRHLVKHERRRIYE